MHNMIAGSSYPSVAEPNSGRDGASCAVSDAAMLEVEIAHLIKNEFNLSGQSDEWTGRPAAWDETRAAQQLTDARHDPNGAYHERPAWDADIKVYDPEKLAGLVSSSAAQIRPPAIIVGVLSLALGIAWVGGWSPNHFVGLVPSLVPVDQKAASIGSDRPISTLPPSAVEPPRQASPSVSTNGTIKGRPTAKGSGDRRDSTQNAVPSLVDTKTAAVAPQSTVPASSAAIHRLPKPLPVPFPETKPTTIDGWVVREVANGTAVLQGPNGVWKAARGDTVPGLGTVDSIVLWGSRWIVSTSRGLITSQ